MTRGQPAATGAGVRSAGSGSERPDPLDAVRACLQTVGELPVEDRPDMFAAVNQTLVAELAAMEEVERARP
ncbi:MAG TPA: hypothetical protein VHF25_13815 [Nitriliruptorales bacterium]|nr:hypothetical protein [Nitriliruptorales bacterium]